MSPDDTAALNPSGADPATDHATPQWRPACHFTPAAHWMNDPNGLVRHRGRWHVFFQHHPQGLDWGPMHWGHASSADLLTWTEHPIALAPDALGMIFSGSAVVDVANTSGFGRDGVAPLVAMFTHHDAAADAAGRQDVEHQSLACSLDGGLTFTKHAGNPVLRSPGVRDFRDPKLQWLPRRGCWSMVLAQGDRVVFHTAPDLQHWTRTGEFSLPPGQCLGAGVWECPDLIALPAPPGLPADADGQLWLLLVSVTQQGPQGGSGTWWLPGLFDGDAFTPLAGARPRWLDWGRDHYAGVSFSPGEGPPMPALLLGWMANWDDIRSTPTRPWRGAMTLPRLLAWRPVQGAPLLAQWPPDAVLSHPQWRALAALPTSGAGHDAACEATLDGWLAASSGVLRLHWPATPDGGFTLELTSAAGDRLGLGFDAASGRYWLDRDQAGGEAAGLRRCGPQAAPRLLPAVDAPTAADRGGPLLVVLDRCSVELFADGGLTAITSLVFPAAPWSQLRITAGGAAALAGLEAWAWQPAAAKAG